MPTPQKVPYVLLPTLASLGKRKILPTGPSPNVSSPSKRRRTVASEFEDSTRDPVEIIDLTDSSDPGDEAVLEEELELESDDENEDGDLPIRRLDEFSVCDVNGNAVSAMELLCISSSNSESYRAAGLARAHHVDSSGRDDDDDDDYGQIVKDLQIDELDVHFVADGELDEKIYIKTPRAWYILENPSSEYRESFAPLWLAHRYTHLAVSFALATPKGTYETFVKSLEKPLDENQLKSSETLNYMDFHLPAIAADLKIKSATLIKHLSSHKFRIGFSKFKLNDPLTFMDKSQGDAFVTSVVGRVVLPHLNVPMSVVGADHPVDVEFEPPVEEQIDHDHPGQIVWEDASSTPGFYGSAVVDDVTYKIGDIVSVKPGEDCDRERADRAAITAKFCVNGYARRVWFIQVQYFFDDEKDASGMPVKKLHGVWLDHGSNTFLQEAAHSQELFLLRECSNVPVSSIFRKCDVRRLAPGEAGPVDAGAVDSTSYFYRLVWDADALDFKDVPSEEQHQARAQMSSHDSCTNCELEAEEDLHRVPIPLGSPPHSFARFGIHYHVGDFVYIKPLAKHKPTAEKVVTLFIAQIENIDFPASADSVVCSVRYFFVDDDDESRPFKDERRLYRTRRKNNVPVEDLDGVCFVKFIRGVDTEAINEWTKHEDHFYTCRKKTAAGLVEFDRREFDARVCHHCLDKHVEAIQRYDLKLSTLDVFAGAGGLSAGMEQTGFIDTKWAIEHCASAAQTFATNHPQTNVLNSDVNAVLKYIVERGQGEQLPPFRSSHGVVIPDENIPRRGEVDLLIGGPPCQPFSRANRKKNKNDIRATLPYTMLSLAEALNPTYVVLENVPGFLYHALHSPKSGEIDMGVVKLVCEALIELDYQVSFKLLQAGEYGAPQDRPRLIIIACKRGHKMPSWPTPTHAFFRDGMEYKMPIRKRDRLRPPARSRAIEVKSERFAVHRPVTVNDAIGDLPPFEWVNPHQFIPQSMEDVIVQREREQDGIVQCQVVKGSPIGFNAPVHLLGPPRTRYQLSMRRQDGLVEHHVTPWFSEKVVETTTLVPLRPWSNHRSVPQLLLPPAMIGPKYTKACFYGRLDGTEYFKTVMTEPAPNKSGYIIHPNQKRSLSLREFARSQGFPDGYILCSTRRTPRERLEDYFKLVGNAVSLPLAAALGRSIGAAAVSDWDERRWREPSVEL